MGCEELARKFVHFLGLSYIPAYEVLGRERMILTVGIVTAFAVLLDLLRRKFEILPDFLLRNYEKRGIGAYVYFGIAAFVITVILPRNACFVGVIVGSLGDGVAGLLKHLFGLGKNAATICMFLVSVFAIHTLGILSVHAVVAVVAGVLVERIERVGGVYVNDNFSVPIVSAFVYQASVTVL